LIEQDTDAHEFDKSGSEGELPPGKISIAYDDVKYTKTTSYSGDEGLLALTVTRNASGATIGSVGGTKGMTLDTVIHCTDDSHGNWTACQQIVKTGGVDRVEKMWRRTITYR
jgi:ribosomal protein L31